MLPKPFSTSEYASGSDKPQSMLVFIESDAPGYYSKRLPSIQAFFGAWRNAQAH